MVCVNAVSPQIHLDWLLILMALLVWQLNLLLATKVGEEGLDIQTCCLVIRFDLPETVASFIQSRGRARMPQSEYVFLVDRCSSKAYHVYNISPSMCCFSFTLFFCRIIFLVMQWKPKGERFDREI